MVHLEVGQPVDRADEKRRPTEREGGVDLVLAVARDRDVQVARDREHRDEVTPGIGAHEQDRVGARAQRGALAAAVRAHHEADLGISQDVSGGGQCGLRPLVDALVRPRDLVGERPVAQVEPEHEQQQDDGNGDAQDPAPPAAEEAGAGARAAWRRGCRDLPPGEARRRRPHVGRRHALGRRGPCRRGRGSGPSGEVEARGVGVVAPSGAAPAVRAVRLGGLRLGRHLAALWYPRW